MRKELKKFRINYGPGSINADPVFEVGRKEPDYERRIRVMVLYIESIHHYLEISLEDGTKRTLNLQHIRDYEYI